MNPVLAVVIALWPLWLALIATYVCARIDVHQDASWEDAPTRPGSLG